MAQKRVFHAVMVGSDEEKECSKHGLKGLLEGLEGDCRKYILGALNDNLVTMYVPLATSSRGLSISNFSFIRTRVLSHAQSTTVQPGSILDSCPGIRNR